MENQIILTHFTFEEIKCKCGCSGKIINYNLLLRLELARRNSDLPFKINSWCRCSQHNRQVGGSLTSSHLNGLAVDIHCPTPEFQNKLMVYLGDAGFRRFGIGDTYLHVDIDPTKSLPAIWYY